MRRHSVWATVAAGAVLLWVPASANARPGALDTTFGGGDGVVFQAVGSFVDGVQAVATTADGGLIVGGRAATTAPSTTSDLGLLALDASGTPRAGFASAGSLEIPLPAGTVNGPVSVGQRPDGSYLIGGIGLNGAIQEIYVATASAAGVASPALAFPLPVALTSITGIDVDAANGFVYVAGAAGAKTLGLLRLNAAGALDSTFGIAEIAQQAIGAGTTAVVGRVIHQSDGKPIVVANGLQADNTTREAAAVRFTTGGQPDPTWGTGGVATVASTPVTQQAPQPIGRMAVSAAGLAFILTRLNGGAAVVRLSPTGQMVTSFGGTGFVPVGNGGFAVPIDLAMADDGSTIVIGSDIVSTAGGTGTRASGYANRLNADGSHDLTFGDTLGNGYGTFTTWFNGATDIYQHAASVLTPAGLVTAGTYLSVVPGAPPSPNPVPSTFAAARLVTAPVPPNKPPVVTLAVAPSSGSSATARAFTASASDVDGSVVRYEWDFDGDGVVDRVTAAGATSYTYAKGGSFTAKVTVFDNAAASAGASATVNVTSASALALTALKKVRGKLTLAKKTTHGKRSLGNTLSKVSSASCTCQYFAVVRRGTTVLAAKQGTLDKRHTKVSFSVRAKRRQKLTETVRLIDTFGNRVDVKVKLTVK